MNFSVDRKSHSVFYNEMLWCAELEVPKSVTEESSSFPPYELIYSSILLRLSVVVTA